MLTKVKLALRIVTTAYDSELTDLIAAAKTDLGIAGVVLPTTLDEICERAIITYCKCNFGEPTDYPARRMEESKQESQLVGSARQNAVSSSGRIVFIPSAAYPDFTSAAAARKREKS